MKILKLSHRLATDPQLQFKFHGFMTLFWLFVMLVVPFTPAFGFMVHVQDQWSSHTAIDAQKLAGLLIMEVSLWANAFTHFGAMSGALAAIGSYAPAPPLSAEHILAEDGYGQNDWLFDEADNDESLEQRDDNREDWDDALINYEEPRTLKVKKSASHLTGR